MSRQLTLFGGAPRAGERAVPGSDAGRWAQLGTRLVAYRLRRTRRRSIALTVDERGLTVSAPLRASLRDIEALLGREQRWVLARLAEWASLPRAPAVHGVDGEAIPYAGTTLRLAVQTGRRRVEHEGAALRLSHPQPHRRDLVLALLLGWLKHAAREAFTPRAAHYAARLGLAAPPVRVSNARTQWGACTERGAIRLHWKLIHLEPALADYVVAHEVAHLVELNHSKRFWNLVAKLYPDWRSARAQLERAGAALPTIGG